MGYIARYRYIGLRVMGHFLESYGGNSATRCPPTGQAMFAEVLKPLVHCAFTAELVRS